MLTRTCIPYRIRVGVTGHRKLENPESLAASIEEILSNRYLQAFTQDAVQAINKASDTPIKFTIISPLAEGADRLVAKSVLQKEGVLEALLPMPRLEYEKDFITTESCNEFTTLLENAHRVNIIDNVISPDDPDYQRKSYRKVGEETTARSDFLIALWDGKEPESDCGTGAIVKLAIDRMKPVFIISTTEPGRVELVNGGTLKADFIAELNSFNSSRIDPDQLSAYAANEYNDLFSSPNADQLPAQFKEIVRCNLIPFYCLTSLIAKDKQVRYLSTGKRAYLFSTLSVAFMAAAIVFAKEPLIALPGYMIELLLLIVLYCMIHRAMHEGVHHRWLEYRVLAERLRMAFYFVACGETPAGTSGGKTVHYHARTWVDTAYKEILYSLPDIFRPESPPISAYAAFIRDGWLAGQLRYHTGKKKDSTRINTRLKRWGLTCFAMAIAVSVVHHLFVIGAVMGHHAYGLSLLLEEALSIIAVTLPAAGAAVNGYRSLLEQSRVASRSAGMVHHLERLKHRSLPDDPAGLRHYLERIEDLMLMESQDWHKFMEHAELDGIA